MRTPAATVTLRGTIDRVVFTSPSGWNVLKILTADRELVCITGNASSAEPGDPIEASGTWETHPRFGRQLKAALITRPVPAGTDGIAKFLANSVEGVGPALAKRIVAAFGERTFEIIESKPELLQTVRGITSTLTQNVVEAVAGARGERNTMAFLLALGITPAPPFASGRPTRAAR